MSVCCLRVHALTGGFWSCADLALCARVGWCLWPLLSLHAHHLPLPSPFLLLLLLRVFAFSGGNKDMEDEDENQVGDDGGFM